MHFVSADTSPIEKAASKYQLAKDKAKAKDFEEATRIMVEARELFSKLNEQPIVTLCDAWFFKWIAEKRWKDANAIIDYVRVEMRKEAVEFLDKAIWYFREAKQEQQSEDALRKKYHWLGLIAMHDLKTSEAKKYFTEAIALAERVDKRSIPYHMAQLRDAEAWELIVRKYEKNEQIEIAAIIDKFEAAIALYQKTENSLSRSYSEGYRDLFRFLDDPTPLNLPLFQSYSSKVLGVEKEKDQKILRLKLKLGINREASAQERIIQNQVRPYYLKEQFEKLAEDLTEWLREKLYVEGFTEKPSSLEHCWKIVTKDWHVTVPPILQWLRDWNLDRKHKINDPKVRDRVMNEAVKNISMLETLPQKIDEFKERVRVQCQRQKPQYPRGRKYVK